MNLYRELSSPSPWTKVEEIVQAGELDPDDVHLPGVYVQRVVQAPPYEKRIEVLYRGNSSVSTVNTLRERRKRMGGQWGSRCLILAIERASNSYFLSHAESNPVVVSLNGLAETGRSSRAPF